MTKDALLAEMRDATVADSHRPGVPAYAWIVLAIALAALIGHIAMYWFLTDDSYISFRYARNLADGYGLVFNPGYERVEGYTNFLWVLMLAALSACGLPPENTANFLSVTAGVLLWGIVARFAIRERRPDRPFVFALTAPVLLAFTRSYAVWCTSGLETKLFELFIVSGVLSAVTEFRRIREGGRAAPVSALLFALATLTRPDALLIAFCVLAAQTLLLRRVRAFRFSRTALAFVIYVAIVGAHELWRHAYYGEWLPNTFYAKTGGGQWWWLGVRYVAMWVVEYVAVLWVPLLIVGAIDRIRTHRVEIPLFFTVAIVPHILYVMSIGGDHFEYRPLDVYFPFIYLLLGDGAAGIAATVPRARAAIAYMCVVLVGVVTLPFASHVAYPDHYVVGFPGVNELPGRDHRLLTAQTNPWLMRVPLVRNYAELYNDLARITTRQFAAIRAEEHRLFLGTVIPEGRALARLVQEGKLPADLHIAVDSVGAIPYYSNLRTLDRLGLTDRVVARSGIRQTAQNRMIAHEVHATLDYAANSGVDLWAAHSVHLLFPPTDHDVFRAAIRASELPRSDVRYVRIEPNQLLVALFPNGGQPSEEVAYLNWKPLPALLTDPQYLRDLVDDLSDQVTKQPSDADAHHLLGVVYLRLGDSAVAERCFRTALELDPNDQETTFDLASLYLNTGRPDLALPLFRRVTEIGTPTAEAFNALGRCCVMLGQAADAITALQEAIKLDPKYVDAQGNLANVLATTGRLDDAKRHYETAIDLAPANPLNHKNLAIVLERAGDEAGAVAALRRGVQYCPDAPELLARLAFLLATSPADSVRDGPAAVELAKRAVAQTNRRDAQSLEALAAAFAATGRFDDAVRIADEVIRICTATGNTALQQRLETARSNYAAGRPLRRERAMSAQTAP